MSELRIGNYSVVVTRRLAEGGFGFVDLVHSRPLKQDFALKRCAAFQSESLEVAEKEAKVLKSFYGKYLPHFIFILVFLNLY